MVDLTNTSDSDISGMKFGNSNNGQKASQEMSKSIASIEVSVQSEAFMNSAHGDLIARPRKDELVRLSLSQIETMPNVKDNLLE